MKLRLFWLQWPLLMLAAIAYFYFTGWSLWHQGLSSNDFKHIYLGMKAILDGNSPYPIQSLAYQAQLQGYHGISLNPYVYLPFTGHSMAFLAPFRLEQAILVWFILNHIFTIASVLLISQIYRPYRVAAAAAMLLSLAFSAPFYRTLSAGQLNMALLFLITLGWHALRHGRPRLCGIIMAVATLYKLMPGLYGIYFLLRRKWHALIAMAVASAVLGTLSLVAIGPMIYSQFLPVLRQMGYGKSTWPHVFSFWDDPANQSVNSFLSHILTVSDHTTPWISGGQHAANVLTVAVTFALLSAYIIAAYCKQPNTATRPSSADEAAWHSTLLVALLIPSLLWDHYLVMLLLPVAWLIRAAASLKRFASAGFVAILYILTCLPWNFESAAWQSGAGIIFMSMKLWPTLILFGLSLCFIRLSVEIVPPASQLEPADNL